MDTLVANDSPEIYWDPFDTEIDTDPYPVWRRMRDESPVYRNDQFDFWALSRFADVEAAHKDPATFLSGRGTVIELMTGGDLSRTGQMIFMDPPEHTMLRTLVSRAFTPRRVSGLEARIRELCAELLDPHVGSTGFDYVKDFGAHLPSMVISALLGVPDDEREEQRRNIDEMFHIEPGVGMINDTSFMARIRLDEYLRDLITRRLAESRDDLITALCQAEVDDRGTPRRLSVEEITGFSLLLFSAGTETVGRLLGNAAVVLCDYPDQRQIMIDEPAVIPNAVEELLRFEAPSPVQARWSTRDMTFHDVTIPADSRVVLLTGSAVRDERKYPDPDRFDVHREIDHHLSFGYGIHFCVGAALARLESRIAIEETLARFPEWGLDHAGVVRQHTSTVRGYSGVKITL